MIKLLRLLAVCSAAALFVSTAWAQHYTQIDYPDPAAIGTALSGGPNPQGTSVGFWYDSAGVVHGFTLTSNLVYKTFDFPGAASTYPAFITPEGIIAGYYIDSSGVSHGFLVYRGKYTTIDVASNSGYLGTVLASINPSGEMTGYGCADAACVTGPLKSFVISKAGQFTFFDPPNTDPSSGSFASVIIPSGAIAGSYWGTDGRLHGFLRYQGSFTAINYPGRPFTFCGGMNAQGDIVGQAFDVNDFAWHSYALIHGVFTSFDPPGAANYNSGATGINPDGVIVGLFYDVDGNEHGYIRTPW